MLYSCGILHTQARCYTLQLMECCTYRQYSSVIRYTVDGMLHIKAIFVCYMLHSWWNVAHTGSVRLFDDTQLMECCTYKQYSSVICCRVDGMLHIQATLVCLSYATQLMGCCTHRQCSSVICYTVNGMLHIQEMYACYMLHSWCNVAHAGNVRLLLCYTVDGMLHIEAMFLCHMLYSWWNIAHTGNVRLLYATQLMECCTYKKCSSVICCTVDGMSANTGNVCLSFVIQLMECCTHRQCSSVICYTVDGLLHMQAMFVCYMLHSWWNVAHTGNARLLYATQLMECCTYKQYSSVIWYTVDGMLHIQAVFVCSMLHSWWNVALTSNIRLLYAAQLMECCTYRQRSSVICYTVNGMLHTQEMFVCYMLHSWWNVAHAGNVRLLYDTQLMECCTYRQCSSVIRYTVDGMLHIKAIFVCYMLHSWWNVAHTGNVRLLYATQLTECCTYRQCSSVICYTVDGMLHIKAIFVCYMLHSWWNIAHTCNVRLLYATQLMECCTYRQCSSALCYTVDGMLHIQAMFVCYMLHS